MRAPRAGLREGPDVARIAALIGDPARAAMLTALMSGKALTATELAHEAGVTPATASSHLAKLENGGLIVPEKQGRHRYMRLADADVAQAIETLMGVAARAGFTRTRTGPRDPALRKARVCYNHLAGDLGVSLFERLLEGRVLSEADGVLQVTTHGRARLHKFGLDVTSLVSRRKPLCRRCLDWSERRSHLGGPLGVAILSAVLSKDWARRDASSRAIIFSSRGEASFRRAFDLD